MESQRTNVMSMPSLVNTDGLMAMSKLSTHSALEARHNMKMYYNIMMPTERDNYVTTMPLF